jgi:23S rRNA G2069 N7-methylase RlmK/C1962 C5-methylase RlmI
VQLALEASSTAGRVVSFDIQQVALDATRRKLQQAGLQPAQVRCVQVRLRLCAWITRH